MPYSFLRASVRISTARRRCSVVPAVAIWRTAMPVWPTALRSSMQLRLDALGDLVPRRGVALLGHLGPALVGEGEAALAVLLLTGDEALVLQHLQGGVDRAGARLPHPVGALGELTDDLVAVHGPLGEQGEHCGPHIAAAGTTAPSASRAATAEAAPARRSPAALVEGAAPGGPVVGPALVPVLVFVSSVHRTLLSFVVVRSGGAVALVELPDPVPSSWTLPLEILRFDRSRPSDVHHDISERFV